jgi:PHD/YefM family antitoxin component YafN of YafNO toxin-antitoxin module
MMTHDGSKRRQQNFGDTLHTLPPNIRVIVRKMERSIIKVLNAEAAVSFNTICLKENIFPNYTKINVHDKSARHDEITYRYRRDLVIRQITVKQQAISDLTLELDTVKRQWDNCDVPVDTRKKVEEELLKITEQHRLVTETRTTKKILALGGRIRKCKAPEGYINLTDLELTPKQKEFLNLGLNCHYITKPQIHSKRVEIEMLLNNILELEREKKVKTSLTLRAELLAEAVTARGSYKSKVLTSDLREAAKQLRENEKIIVRKADKASIFVLIPRDEYNEKMDAILSDPKRFKRITRNPIEELKKKINRLIDATNKKVGRTVFHKRVGDYTPGYAYGSIKTHKEGNPLRPIISQLPSPTHDVAKILNTLLAPYCPSDYCVNSSVGFIDLIKAKPPTGLLASLDVESLFTNVPVDETINLILKKVYHDKRHTPLDIPEATLKKLLVTCTKEAPFFSPKGEMYVQIDGVAMGSPLGPLFANFYLGSIEEKVFQQHKDLKPSLYCRYVDDIFLTVSDHNQLDTLKNIFESNSCLKFTYESSENILPFLDVSVRTINNIFSTEVHTKKNNPGFCMNGISECPDRYKRSVINAYVNRAFTHCSNWNLVHKELERLTNVLVNNGFPHTEIQEVIAERMKKWHSNETPPPDDKPPPIVLHYQNHMSSAYREDEKVMKDIVKRGVESTTPQQLVKLVIYYKNKKTSEVVIKNSPIKRTTDLKQSSVVYEYSCPLGDCKLQSKYIGMTETTLSRRLTCHLTSGAPKVHTLQVHGEQLTRTMLENNTVILARASDHFRLKFLEAVFILNNRPNLNVQTASFDLLPSVRVIRKRCETTGSEEG